MLIAELYGLASFSCDVTVFVQTVCVQTPFEQVAPPVHAYADPHPPQLLLSVR
jgi:hypothetical protein